MKLGIIADYSPEGINWAADRGFDLVEFDYNVGNDPKALRDRVPALKEAFASRGSSLGALGRWGTRKYDDEGNLNAEEFEGQKVMLDTAAQLGCPVYISGVEYNEKFCYDKNIELAVNYFSKLCDEGDKAGVKIAVYNCDWGNFVRKPKEWGLVMGAEPRLGIKYDPSHCINVHHGNYLQEIADWGEKIYHFHVKGTININGDHVDDPPAGLDAVNWRAVMGLLYARHYDGMLSIEPHSHTWQSGELGDWGIQLTKKYISEMVF